MIDAYQDQLGPALCPHRRVRDRPALPVADRLEALACDAAIDERVRDLVRSLLGDSQVVLGAPARIAVHRDPHAGDASVGAQELGQRLVRRRIVVRIREVERRQEAGRLGGRAGRPEHGLELPLAEGRQGWGRGRGLGREGGLGGGLRFGGLGSSTADQGDREEESAHGATDYADAVRLGACARGRRGEAWVRGATVPPCPAAMDELKARVDSLLKEGRHAEAADLYLAKGHIERAAELFAAVWKWDRAIGVAEQNGFLDVAYRHALSANDREACGRLLMSLEGRPEQSVRAAEYAESKGLLLDAARLREAAGETEIAAQLFERGGEYRDAARCRLVLGQARRAGMLLEKRLREDPEDAESGLALGRILAQFGRWDHAVRALQKAAQDAAHQPAALRLMIACFAAMGMDEAAGSRLDALREHEPDLPVTVPRMLEQVYGDARGLAAMVGQDDSDRLLAGRYRVIRPLGAGATGRVLLAHDAFHEREVAVKVLNVGGGAVGRDAFVRFGREARVAAGIDHPNVVRVFEFNPDGPFIVMEFLAGGTLAERLVGPDDSPLFFPPPQTSLMAKGVLSALEVVHRRGVVHRDLKPANIFFGHGGDAKLGDFGVAHLTDLGATLTGAMVGTLAYMSPEQITGSTRPDASTDLYAMGVILFRCLTGRLPFEGPDFVAQHLEEQPPRASEVAPWLGVAFDPVIGKLLEKEPRARYSSANDLLDALRPLPWDDAEEARPSARPPASAPASPAPPALLSEDRYEVIEQRADGTTIARDELLERTVELVRLDGELAERLRGFARADGPFLQAVYEVDENAGRAILEHPAGVNLATLGSRDPRRHRAVPDIRSAVERMHAADIVHGDIRAGRVIVGDARAVLRLNLRGDVTDPQHDVAGVDALGGRRTPG